MKKFVIGALGILLIAVGIVGLILPILPGWIFIFLGLSFFAPRFAGRLRWWLFKNFFKSDIVYLEEWKKLSVQAGFTTRRFPLVLKKTEELVHKKNRHLFQKLFSASKVTRAHELRTPDRLVLLEQVHEDKIVLLEDGEKHAAPGVWYFPGSDGALTNIQGLTLFAFSADCLSVFFFAGEWVGLAHAGWRGSRLKIAPQLLIRLAEKAGVLPQDVKIVFGPSIGACHYEVGPEFKDYFPASALSERDEKIFFDLAKENERQLLEAGALLINITSHGICTFEEKKNFYSFRRDHKKAGRTISFISRS